MDSFSRIYCSSRPKNFFSAVKYAIVLLVIALVFGSSVLLVVNTNQRMASYEEKIDRMSSMMEIQANLLDERMKRAIADSAQDSRDHRISKRSERNVSMERPYLEPLNGERLKYEIQDHSRHPGGVTYIRWGRRDCPKKALTRFVYSGYVAGGHYTHTGSGSNFLCLHWNVSYTPGKFVEGNQGGSYIYGTEFRDSAWMYKLFDLSLTETAAMQFHSVPCALCMSEARITQIMVPGRDKCPDGWNQEYTGYIMAGSHGDKHTSKFLCIDDQPHVVPGTIGDQGGGSLQVVETQCGSLPCEPFVVGRELRCVVCSM